MSAETERSSTESSAASGLDFEDTALTLTLRLPGSSPASDPDRKRGASSSSSCSSVVRCPLPAKKTAFLSCGELGGSWLGLTGGFCSLFGFARARVVGWPPVRSFRKNALADVAAGTARATKFVKVAVDGAPYLRKVNLPDYAGYGQLLRALQDKFCSHFTIRKFANDEMKLVDAVNGTEYVPTYEDKDGDWMLVGDVPWKMFVEACQRVRLMKNSEAVNLAPRGAH